MEEIINMQWKEAEKAARTLTTRLLELSGLLAFKARDTGQPCRLGVVILGRGGLAAASLLSRVHLKLFNNPTVYLPYAKAALPPKFQYKQAVKLIAMCSHFLLVDDVYDSGATFRRAAEDIHEKINFQAQVIFTPLVSKVKLTTSLYAAGFLTGRFLVTNKWIRFPWEFEEGGE